MNLLIFSILLITIFLTIIIFVSKTYQHFQSKEIKIHKQYIKDYVNYNNIVKSCIIQLCNYLKQIYTQQIIDIDNNHDTKTFINTYIIDKMNDSAITGTTVSTDASRTNILRRFINYIFNVGNDSTHVEGQTYPTSQNDYKKEQIYSDLIKLLKNPIDKKIQHIDRNTGLLKEINLASEYDLIKYNLINKNFNKLQDNFLNILESTYSKYNNLPCILYSKSECPIDTTENNSTNLPCLYDNNNKICYPKDIHINSHIRIEDCSALSKYGEKYCKKVKDISNKYCNYNSNHNQCSSENPIKILPTVTSNNNTDCGMYDNSAYYYDTKSKKYTKKPEKLNDSEENLLTLCNNNDRCKSVSETLYNNDNVNTCIPKDYLLSATHINNKEECESHENYKWSNVNNKCINISESECNNIENNVVCNYKNNCYWENAGNIYNGQNRNYGYCKEFDISKIDNLLDKIHEHEIKKIAKLKILDEQINKSISKFNKFISN
jgi:hypothetical protein